MRILPTVVFALAATQESVKKVPPRHPLQRLKRLVEFTENLMTNWFGFLPSQQAWIQKFENQAERMKRSFERCGFYDSSLQHGGPPNEKQRVEADEIDIDRYNREDPVVGVKQLTTGFSKWADRYLSACSGQKNYKH